MEEIVTPEILNAIIKNCNANRNSCVELVDFIVKRGTIAGDNYVSIIYAVKVTLKNVERSGSGGGGDEVEVLPVMLKVLPRNEIRVKIINEANVFLKDVYMYDKIIPAMEQFQREKVGFPDSDVCVPWPKCFASKTDGKDDYLAMEDLKAQGYKMSSRRIGLDFDHSKLVMEMMARFHAVSYAMFLGDFVKILETYPWLEEQMLKTDRIPPIWWDMAKRNYAQQAAKVREMEEEFGASFLEKLYSDDYFQELYELVGGKKKWAVIGHGDCWTNNFLFCNDEESKKPVDVKFVDYQLSRVASRAVDIQYFLHSSLQIYVLNEKEKELEQVYFEEFTKFVRLLGVNVEDHELTKENFEKEIELMKYYGLTSGLMLAPLTSADSDVAEMENISEEDMKQAENGTNFLLDMMKELAMDKVKNLSAVHLPRCIQMKKYLQ